MSTAASVLERCAALGRVSEEPERLVRRYATPAMREAYGLVGGWMRDAGLTVREDAAGNLIGRRDGPGRTLVLGSHLDTVVDAGRYDGPLGVLAAIAVLERMWDRALPYAVEVIAFADEEGVRYGTTFLGSSAVAGRFAPAWLALADDDGVTMADALRAFGGDPEAIASAALRGEDLLGYVEVHIEQGPVLERRGAPLGVVTTITGQTHAEVGFLGEAGHAGTVPMNAAATRSRRGGVDRRRRGGRPPPPGHGRHRRDDRGRPGRPQRDPWRGADDARRAPHLQRGSPRGDRRPARRGAADRRLARGRARLGRARGDRRGPDLARPRRPARRRDRGRRPRFRAAPSGAGHDAVAMAALTEIAMLFVRCERGISHNPAEAVAEADVAVALDVLERFLGDLA